MRSSPWSAITFLLPGFASRPSGGFKVIYQIADGLAQRGRSVRVVHCLEGTDDSPGRPTWFPVASPRIIWSTVSDADVPGVVSDVTIATGWRLAGLLDGLPPNTGRKIFFVQGYEHWFEASDHDRAAMARDLRGDFELICPSSAACTMLETMSLVPDLTIRYGFSNREFGIDTPIDERDPRSIVFPIRVEACKGTTDALVSAEILRRSLRGTTICAFGAMERPRWLPMWLEYYHFPSNRELRQLYNRCAVFLLPSRVEGFGLPALEAMACGATVVASDCHGVKELLEDEVSGLLVPAGQPEHLARAIGRLFMAPWERIQLAHNAMKRCQQFEWTPTIERLDSFLT